MNSPRRSAIRRISRLGIALAISILIRCLGAAAAPPEHYETGGPLAGVKIQADARSGYGDAGYQYSRDLYPGSVEHYRCYWHKYVPARSFFDRQSQVKNFLATDLAPAGSPLLAEYAEPIGVYSPGPGWNLTDHVREPVVVVRAKARNPVFKLDLGALEIGMYCVRLVGAVAPIKGQVWRLPLFVTLKVNDGNNDEINTYRQRCGYDGEFYSISEIYFHAPAKRHYTAELYVDDGSQVEVMVHNIILDDALAGTERRAIKTRMTLASPEEQARVRDLLQKYQTPQDQRPARPEYYGANAQPFTKEERWKQDERLWKKLPPLNLQAAVPPGGSDELATIPGLTIGTPDKKGEDIVKEFGEWKLPRLDYPSQLSRGAPVLAENKQLKLSYSLDDFQARKPFADPYAYKDDGTGLVWLDAKDPSKGCVWAPLGDLAFWLLRAQNEPDTRQWLATGEEAFARDAAVQLIHWAYDYPSRDDANTISSVICQPGPRGRDYRFRDRRERVYTPSGGGPSGGPYDLLFEYIKGNQDLADSVHRFIPWVKTSQDLIQLIDTYYMQTVAKEYMRYQIMHSAGAVDLPMFAAVMADNKLTDPWMEWMFSCFWVYPSRPEGIQNSMINGCDRSGAEAIGSTHYAASGAMDKAAILDLYLAAGGNPKYDLSNPAVYPKPLAQCYWFLNISVAGQEWLRVGDVSGPEKPVGRFIDPKMLAEAARCGWTWSGDPRFAWLLKNLIGRQKESNEAWAKIDAVSSRVKRAPWLDLRSRSVENWAAILESGLQHDDFRFRRAVYVRTGAGYGHAHEDALDLQIVAHGLPMTINGGQRGGYSKPRDSRTRVHNTVEVDGKNHRSYAHAQTIADAPGGRYEQVDGVPPDGANLFRRQVALIDVDEGQGSQPLSIEQQKPEAKLPANVATPNSYVFDVFRVSGGKMQSYNFHGPVNGGVPTVPGSFECNMEKKAVVPHMEKEASLKEVPATDAAYLSGFELSADSKFAGAAPDTLMATWKYLREGIGSEQGMLGKRLDPTSPVKFTRLHLVGLKDARALQADSRTTSQSPVQYRWTQLMVQRRTDEGNLESAWTAIIEPYAGQPFIKTVKLLAVPGNETDARKAVAVEVKTANGHTDLCFADGRPEKIREFRVQSSEFRVSGEFAFYSTDAQGLRQATLARGTILEGPEVKLAVSRRELTGKITAVNYAKKTLTIDTAWPASAVGRVFEIGQPGHWTSYSSVRLASDGKGTEITVDAGADFYRSQIVSLRTDSDTIDQAIKKAQLTDSDGVVALVDCAAEPPPMSQEAAEGRCQKWVASNDQATRFWRADLVGGSRLVLRGAPVTEKDFGPSGALRLWEYGVGDTVRQGTFASLRRLETFDKAQGKPGVYELTGDLDAELKLPGGKLQKITAEELGKNAGKIKVTAN